MISTRCALQFLFNKRFSIAKSSRSMKRHKYSNSLLINCNRHPHGNVADFYAGKSVFITGGTGFLGKAFIEKLLYSCTDVEKIYVLIRETEGLSASERLNNLLKNPIFSRLKEEKPKALEKIVPIKGDIETPKLGITTRDEEILIEKVSVVIHSAATTYFNEPLAKALQINYEGTKNILDLCKKMVNMQAYVHISTAYANTDKKVIEEHVYPAPADVSQVYDELTRLGSDSDKIRAILNGRPNTYTFTKALAETLIAAEHGNVPTLIIRPTIVCPSISEPFKGWVDNMSLATKFLLSGASGLNHVVRGRPSNIVDIIPVDYVANFTLVAASTCQRSNRLEVYNCGTSSVNPILLNEIFELFNKAGIYKYNLDNFSFPKVFIVQSKLARDVITFFAQLLPAYVIDLLRVLTGKRPRYIKQQKKIINTRNSYDYFTKNSWIIKTNRILDIHKKLSEHDQSKFPFDISRINWHDYMKTYARAIQHLMNHEKVAIQKNSNNKETLKKTSLKVTLNGSRIE